MCLHVICNGFKPFQRTLRLVHHGLVLQHATVMRDVDARGLCGERYVDTLRFGMAFAERLERRDRFWRRSECRFVLRK